MSFQFGDEEVFLWMEDSVGKYRNIYNKKINNPLKSYMDKADPIATVVKMISENIDKDNVLERAVKNSTEKSFQNFHGKQWENLILLKEGWEEPPRLLDVAKKDEHTAALDPKIAEIIMNLTNKLYRQYNLTILMITHNIKHAFAYGDRTIMLQDGAIIKDLKGEERAKVDPASLLSAY